MKYERKILWPSGDCRAVLATLKKPTELVHGIHGSTFRERDDLDWFEASIVEISDFGHVLILKYDNDPMGFTIFHVDAYHDPIFAETRIVQNFGLSSKDVKWRLSDVPRPLSG